MKHIPLIDEEPPVCDSADSSRQRIIGDTVVAPPKWIDRLFNYALVAMGLGIITLALGVIAHGFTELFKMGWNLF